jgi:hypothetical protein
MEGRPKKFVRLSTLNCGEDVSLQIEIMKIQINTDHNIQGSESLSRHTETVVQDALGHLAEHITRVEVHLSDENAKKSGEHDKRCMMEARLQGHQPIAVTHEAETIEQAIGGAAGRLKSLVEHTLGRLSGR